MKNNKLLLVILICLCTIFPFKVFAQNNDKLEVDLSTINLNDTFKSHDGNEYIVTQVNEAKIYIDDEKQDIYSFEIYININDNNVWRKFVKLDDLCQNENVCSILDKDEYIELKRTNVMNNKIYKLSEDESLEAYYRTVYDYDKKEFASLFTIGDENYKFNYDNNDDSKFSNEGVLTADVEVLRDKNDDIYVSLRFVTEALGAEVEWIGASEDSSDKVNIRFYDNESYPKTIITSLDSMCDDIDSDELDDIEKCDDEDSDCLNSRCKTYIEENLDDTDEFEIKYNYVDEKGNLRKFKAEWNKENIYTNQNNTDNYGIILYKGVPLIIDIFDGIESEDAISEKTKCLMEGNVWQDDEHMIKLSEKDEAFCSINMYEQITISGAQ